MSDQLNVTPVVLEPAAQAFTEATADPPYLFDLGPIEGRKTVDEVNPVMRSRLDEPTNDELKEIESEEADWLVAA